MRVDLRAFTRGFFASLLYVDSMEQRIIHAIEYKARGGIIRPALDVQHLIASFSRPALCTYDHSMRDAQLCNLCYDSWTCATCSPGQLACGKCWGRDHSDEKVRGSWWRKIRKRGKDILWQNPAYMNRYQFMRYRMALGQTIYIGDA